MTKGTIFNIQRFSIQDGPGIRTTVFLKGCSLRCFWCHNPESLNPEPEIEFFSDKCLRCGKCIETCPTGALKMIDGKRSFLRDNCTGCGKCVEICPASALAVIGKVMTVDEIVKEVEKDRLFYESSGGGVTFSGGEPLLQRDFLKALLIECKARNIHTAVETASNVPWQSFNAIIPYVDLFICDIKAMDEKVHTKATCAGNKLILENILKLSKTGKDIWIKIPVVPGINDTPEEMEKIAEFVKEIEGVKLVELLAFHDLGGSKYKRLGLEYAAKSLTGIDDHMMDMYVDLIQMKGLPAKKG